MTATKEQLQALLERVEAATGPDRGIDEALMSMVYTRDERHIGAYMENDFGRDEPVKDKVWVDPQTDKWVYTHPYELTRSIDAALALVERCFPGYGALLETRNDGFVMSWLSPNLNRGETGPTGDCRTYSTTLPLAILAALLKALIAQSEEGK